MCTAGLCYSEADHLINPPLPGFGAQTPDNRSYNPRVSALDYTLPMRGASFAVCVVSAAAVSPQSTQSEPCWCDGKKAQTYDSQGSQPILCFAVQVKVVGKRLPRKSFALFSPDQDGKCCGALLKSAWAEQHGHFLVEPLVEGQVFRQISLERLRRAG